MAEMHEWDEPGFWVKKKPAKDNMKLTHVSVAIKDVEEAISRLMWLHRRLPESYKQTSDVVQVEGFVKQLQSYLPED